MDLWISIRMHLDFHKIVLWTFITKPNSVWCWRSLLTLFKKQRSHFCSLTSEQKCDRWIFKSHAQKYFLNLVNPNENYLEKNSRPWGSPWRGRAGRCGRPPAPPRPPGRRPRPGSGRGNCRASPCCKTKRKILKRKKLKRKKLKRKKL